MNVPFSIEFDSWSLVTGGEFKFPNRNEFQALRVIFCIDKGNQDHKNE